jgi:hypothetical protein
MERYLPDSVQYCSLARVHKITKYFNMVEASQKGFVTHVVMCDRNNPPFDSPTLSSSKKKRGPPKMDNFTCKQLGQNEGHVQNVSSHNSEQLSLLEFRSFDKQS